MLSVIKWGAHTHTHPSKKIKIKWENNEMNKTFNTKYMK